MGLVWAGLAPVAPFRPGSSRSPLYPGSAQRGCRGEPSLGPHGPANMSLALDLLFHPTSLCVRCIFFFPFGCTAWHVGS